jgi:hypothetical protein
MASFKRFLPLLLIFALVVIPFNSALAAGGLISGKASSNYPSVTQATDGNSNTYINYNKTDFPSYIEYTFPLSSIQNIFLDVNREFASGYLRFDFYNTTVSNTSIVYSVSTTGMATKDFTAVFKTNNAAKVNKFRILHDATQNVRINEMDIFDTEVIVKTEVGNVKVDSITQTSAKVNWTNPQGFMGVTFTGAKIYLDGALKYSATTNETSYSFSDLIPGKTYSLKVAASYSDNSVTTGINDSFNTVPIPKDETPPSKPTGLIAEFDGKSAVNLSFNANTESDLDHYIIYRNDSKLVTTKTNSLKDTSIQKEKTYIYEVSAVDKSGNESPRSDSFSVSTAEKFDINFIPNADSIYIQVSGGQSPYKVKWAPDKEEEFDTSAHIVRDLTMNTDYVFTVSDSKGQMVSKSINTGSTQKYLPPIMPNPSNYFQNMLDSFGTAGIIAVTVIASAVALGIITVLGVYGWRTFKKWLTSAK